MRDNEKERLKTVVFRSSQRRRLKEISKYGDNCEKNIQRELLNLET